MGDEDSRGTVDGQKIARVAHDMKWLWESIAQEVKNTTGRKSRTPEPCKEPGSFFCGLHVQFFSRISCGSRSSDGKLGLSILTLKPNIELGGLGGKVRIPTLQAPSTEHCAQHRFDGPCPPARTDVLFTAFPRHRVFRPLLSS